MTERISSYVSEQTGTLIEDLADHHDISESRAIQLLIREGIIAREHRLRLERLDAKLDIILELVGGNEQTEERISERLEAVTDYPFPDSTFDADLADTPHPLFRSPNLLGTEFDEDAIDRLRKEGETEPKH